MSFSVRPARAEDLPALIELMDEVVAFHHREAPTQFREPKTVATKLYLEERLENPEAAIFVSEDQGKLTGALVAVIHEAPPILVPNRVVLLENLVVSFPFRRSGIGRKLVEAATLWTRARDLEELNLNVYEFNLDAIRFYEVLGFQTVSRRMRLPLLPIVETKH